MASAGKMSHNRPMARKKKKQRFSAITTVKEMARERIGAPPSSRVLPDGKRKQRTREKHRPKLESLLEDT